MEGAYIIPFTANNLNIFVSAVVAQLPNVTARDIVISQVGAACHCTAPAAGLALHKHAWSFRVCSAVQGRCMKAASSSCSTGQGRHMDPHGAGCTSGLPEWECRPVLWPPAGHSSSMASARLGLGRLLCPGRMAMRVRCPGIQSTPLQAAARSRQQSPLLEAAGSWSPPAGGFPGVLMHCAAPGGCWQMQLLPAHLRRLGVP